MSVGARFKALVLAVIVGVVAVAAILASNFSNSRAQSKASEDQHYLIALFVSSKKQDDPTEWSAVEAIKAFTRERVRAINKAGGINGRRVVLNIYNDEYDPEKTIQHVNDALSDKNLIAMFGIWNNSRGERVVKMIDQRKVPYIGELGMDELFKDSPSIYTMISAISHDARVFTHFMQDNFRRIAYVSVRDEADFKIYHAALQRIAGEIELQSAHWIGKNDVLDTAAAALAIADIKLRRPDVVCLGLYNLSAQKFLKMMMEAELDIPVYLINASIENVTAINGGVDYPGDMIEAGPDIPGVANERLARLSRSFGLARNAAYAREDIGYGLMYADVLMWIREAAEGAPDPSPQAMRAHIASNLASYRMGRRVFHGALQDWSFTELGAVARDPLISWRPKGSQDIKLWPKQYLYDGKEIIKRDLAYINVDMVRVEQVDSGQKSFLAEFFVSLESRQDIGLEDFEFANAWRSEANGEPLVKVDALHERNAPAAGTEKRTIYKVSGRFRFQPDLALYPFDQQRFSIVLQPRNSTSPILIQPAPRRLRDDQFEFDGWTLLNERSGVYVSSEPEIVTATSNLVSEREVLPFDRYNFTWVGKRQSLNYYLRVVVPLALIIVAAYASLFVPHSSYDSAVAIQVTALLATIALYFSIPKFDSEIATISDKVFVFSELIVVLLLVSSIARASMAANNRDGMARTLTMTQKIVVPLGCFLMLRYIWAAMTSTGIDAAEQSIWEVVRRIFGL